MKRMFEAKKLMSNAGSLAKSGGFGNTPWVNAKPITSTPMNQSKIEPGRERGGDRRIAAGRNRDPGQEQLGDVPAPEREHVVDRVADHVGAPDVAPADLLARVGGAQRRPQRARAQQQIEPEAAPAPSSSAVHFRSASCEKNVPALSSRWSTVQPIEHDCAVHAACGRSRAAAIEASTFISTRSHT